MADYTVKQHDQGITLEFPLEQWNPVTQAWAPFPGLDTATQLRLLMRGQTAFGPGVQPTFVLVVGIAEYGGTPGLVTYTVDADDLDYAGIYDAEIEVTSAGGIIETVPGGSDGRYFTIEIVPDLG